MTFYSIMIANDKHQCTNDFVCIAKINKNKNCISHIIPMCYIVRNHVKHNTTEF